MLAFVHALSNDLKTTMNRLILGLLLCLSFWSHSTLASVLAIDYGTDWIKASLMAPGVPFDVLLNRDSKRKIQSSVGWKKEDRLFASDAFNIVSTIVVPQWLYP